MVIGYLDARVGEDNTGRERAVGTQCFGCASNNGEILSDLRVESTLVIGGTLFMHIYIHNTTGDRHHFCLANSNMLLQTRNGGGHYSMSNQMVELT